MISDKAPDNLKDLQEIITCACFSNYDSNVICVTTNTGGVEIFDSRDTKWKRKLKMNIEGEVDSDFLTFTNAITSADFIDQF